MTLRIALAGAALAVAAAGAQAQDFTINAGATLTSNYLLNGLTQTQNGPAFQPYVEVEAMGIYAGLWASNVRFPGSKDRAEIDVYAGYRNQFGAFSFDAGYARYLYSRSGDCCGEWLLSLGFETDMGMSFGADGGYDPASSARRGSLSAAYAMDDRISFSAESGRVSGSHNFWNAGMGVSVMDNMALDLRLHDTNITRPRVTAGMSFDFSLR